MGCVCGSSPNTRTCTISTPRWCPVCLCFSGISRPRNGCYFIGKHAGSLVGCLENFSGYRCCHWFKMHSIPEMLNAPGEPIYCVMSSWLVKIVGPQFGCCPSFSLLDFVRQGKQGLDLGQLIRELSWYPIG